MSEQDKLLGNVAAEVVIDFITRGHPGIKLQEVTQFDFETFLKKIVGVTGRLKTGHLRALQNRPL